MSNRIVHRLGLVTPSPVGLHEAVERLHRQGYAGTVQYILAQAQHASAPRDRGYSCLRGTLWVGAALTRSAQYVWVG